MFFRILKKELKRKKGINIILFLFILLATIFVASSVNNILVVKNATNYCMDMGNVPDDCVWMAETMDGMDAWLKDEGKEYYDSYNKDEAIALDISNIEAFDGKDGNDYDIVNSIMLQCQWDKYLTVYNQEGQRANIKDGTICMLQEEMDRNKLDVGDDFTIKFGDYSKTYKVGEPIRDPAFEGDFIGETRYFISEDDYAELRENTTMFMYIYDIETESVEEFSKQLNRQDFSIMVEIDRNLFAFTYVMSLITAGVLTIVGVCLIVIAFLVLKFTISVTLQEDYKEIGIMKAIGIKDFGIKKLYLVKYFMLSLVASILGCILSFPVSDAMVDLSASSMMMQKSSVFMPINIIASILVLIVVIAFCYISTNKLKKFSAMEAIRNGSNGERYSKTSRMSLHKKKKMSSVIFMAINDILSKTRRYIVMVLTFMIGMALIILCSNTIATFYSDGMSESFLFDTNAEAYLQANKIQEDNKDTEEIADKTTIEKSIDLLETKLSDKGYDATIHTLALQSVSIYTKGNEIDTANYVALQPIGSDGSYIKVTEGRTPELENEVVVSEKILDKMKLNVGDTIYLKINNKDIKMIISGSYQNYMQMGETLLLSEELDAGPILATGCWYYQVDVKNAEDYDVVIESLEKDFPKYDWLDSMGAMRDQLGSTIDQIAILKIFIIVLVCALNMLLTVLMMKIFIMGERGQIAMLRSIGFSVRRVRIWQVVRMGIVLVLGVVLGILISLPLNNLAIQPIFGMMGATHMKIVVNVLETYILYPVLLLVCVILAAYISSGSVKKMNIMEINNVE